MPLIPYPDIPKLPGVPSIPRLPNVSSIIAYFVKKPKLSANAYGAKWGFIAKTGTSILTPDSFVDFEYREERKIPNYPVEGGSFSSYNKVVLPFDLRVTISCNGKGQMTKEGFLTAIENLMNSLDLITVITPNFNYENCNLVHVDYRREAKQGVSLILAQLWFQQVRIAIQAIPTTTKPSGVSTYINGQVSPLNPPIVVPSILVST